MIVLDAFPQTGLSLPGRSCAWSPWPRRLAWTIVQGVLGVVAMNVDMLAGCAVLGSAWCAVAVALAMTVLSPVMAGLGAALQADGGRDE